MKKFTNYAATPENKNWKNIIQRENHLYTRNNDIRDEFQRDYTRIIHCNAYKRLKHKTQVFFSPENDHICTRIEHVTHVESISYTIAKYLGLNTELTKDTVFSEQSASKRSPDISTILASENLPIVFSKVTSTSLRRSSALLSES